MPTVSRRALLAGAAATLVAPPSLAVPAVIPPAITPEAFGAGHGAAADTAAWNEAVAASARSGRPVVARGTYVLAVAERPRWHWWNRSAAPVRIAVELRSGVRIEGDATILVGLPDGPVAGRDERHLLFGTAPHAGRLAGISMEGLTFDFSEEFGPVHRYTYATGLVGVDGFMRRGCRYLSTGTRSGRGLLSEDVRQRDDADLDHRNVIQGIYTRYERGVTMRDIRFDGFNEALDFDGPCWDVVLDRLRFRNAAREGQCIDTGGGARWRISDVEAVDTGPILYVYLKPNAWPTYAEWLVSEGRMSPDYVIPEQLWVRGVRGSNAGFEGRKGEAVRIGSRRNRRLLREGPLPRSPHDIVLEDIVLEGGGEIAVNDCDGLALRRVALNATAFGPAALVLDPGKRRFGGRVTGIVTDLEIACPQGEALAVAARAEVVLDDVVVRLPPARATRETVRIRAPDTVTVAVANCS